MSIVNKLLDNINILWYRMIKYYIRIKLCSTILLICIIISEDYLLKKQTKKLIPRPKMWQHFEICSYSDSDANKNCVIELLQMWGSQAREGFTPTLLHLQFILCIVFISFCYISCKCDNKLFELFLNWIVIVIGSCDAQQLEKNSIWAWFYMFLAIWEPIVARFSWKTNQIWP